MTILLTILSSVICWIGGTMFWAIVKKNQCIDSLLRNKDFLLRYLAGPGDVSVFDAKDSYVWQAMPCRLQMDFVVRYTMHADIRVKLIGVVLAAAGLVMAALTVGWLSLIPLAIFVSLTWVPLFESGRKNALGTIMELAVAMNTWMDADHLQVKEYVSSAQIYQSLHDVLIELRAER